MLNLRSKRYDSGIDSTLSLCTNQNSNEFICFFLEDEQRDVKVAGETRIPAGTYEIKLRNVGGMTKRYASKWSNKGYPAIHRGMLELQNVKNFDWVYIHVGNTDDHTEGCLLAGFNAMHNVRNGGGVVGRSVDAYIELYKMCLAEFDNNEKVFITIED